MPGVANLHYQCCLKCLVFAVVTISQYNDFTQDQNSGMFTMIHDVMTELIEFRRRLLSSALTQGQMAELKSKIASKIDWGNKYVDFFVVSFQYLQ